MSVYKNLPAIMKKYAQDASPSVNSSSEDSKEFDKWVGNIQKTDPEYLEKVGPQGARDAFESQVHESNKFVKAPPAAKPVGAPSVDQYVAKINAVVSNGKMQAQRAQTSGAVSESLLTQFLSLRPAYLAVWNAYNIARENPYSDPEDMKKMNRAISDYSAYQKDLHNIINGDLLLNPNLKAQYESLKTLSNLDKKTQTQVQAPSGVDKVLNQRVPSTKELDPFAHPKTSSANPAIIKSATVEGLQRLRATLNFCNNKNFELDESGKEALRALLKKAYHNLK